MRVNKLFLSITLILIFFVTNAEAGIITMPRVASPAWGTLVDSQTVINAIEDDEELQQKFSGNDYHYRISKEYVLYPEALVAYYFNRIPEIPVVRQGDQFLDRDHVAAYYRAILRIYMPGIACFEITGRDNKIAEAGQQQIIGVVTEEYKIIWLWGDPYWYNALTDLKFE